MQIVNNDKLFYKYIFPSYENLALSKSASFVQATFI